jgi:hypothetical protein
VLTPVQDEHIKSERIKLIDLLRDSERESNAASALVMLTAARSLSGGGSDLTMAAFTEGVKLGVRLGDKIKDAFSQHPNPPAWLSAALPTFESSE